MAEFEHATRDGYDAAIVGASLAGCATAISLGRAGLRVALVEKRPDMEAYKRICTHYIQSSAVKPLERLELLEPMMRAGAIRSRVRLHSPLGWLEPPADSRAPSGVNLRRERLDPLIRGIAAETPGVELMLGEAVEELIHDGETVVGVRTRDPHGQTRALRARLVVGADGRGSRVAKLTGAPVKTVEHNRFAYGGYFEGPAPVGSPDCSLWLLDPDMGAVFPTDEGLNFYACMPVKDRLADFRSDPAKALVEFLSGMPDAPPIGASRLVGQVQGKIDMTNVAYRPAGPGFALVGDAAMAIDPLWGVGCGWAFQSSEWLTDGVTRALRGEEPLKKGLARYRRRHARGLKGHAAMIYDYAGGRKLNRAERNLFWAAMRDEKVAEVFEAFGTRNIGPAKMLAQTMPRIALLGARHRLSKLARGRGSGRARAEAGSA
jgi:2-polyprenyl-6-methoxyphenol hydroxylase-like FAD-dependent oxidoreductase